MRLVATCATALLLTACGQTFEEKQAEALAAEPRIAAGVYSNVRTYSAPAMDEGVEIELLRGSDSASVRFINCEASCQSVQNVRVRRGLGGVAFAVQHGDTIVDVSVQPNGNNAVIVTADWGAGLQQQRLVRVPRPLVLDARAGD